LICTVTHVIWIIDDDSGKLSAEAEGTIDEMPSVERRI
jgi:hypothetical protein